MQLKINLNSQRSVLKDVYEYLDYLVFILLAELLSVKITSKCYTCHYRISKYLVR